MNSCELATFVSSIACTLFRSCSREELPLIASILTQLGYTLETILANEELCEERIKQCNLH